MKHISIIIPHYNCFDTLNNCIISLNNSSFKDFEIIVVNNNSTDNSIDKIGKLYQNITIINSQINLGYSGGCNLGAKHAKGKYLLLIMIMTFLSTGVTANYNKLAYDFNFNDLDGTPLNLKEYKNKVIVVINVASQCGFTSQYTDMQKVWDEYQVRGVIILGVP